MMTKALPDIKYTGKLKLINVNQILQLTLSLPEPEDNIWAEVPVVFSFESDLSGVISNFVNRIYIYSINGVQVEDAHAWVGNITQAGAQDYLFTFDGCTYKITDVQELF